MLLYEVKAKQIYSTYNENELIVYYNDVRDGILECLKSL